MGVRLRQATNDDLAVLLERCCAEELTYAPTGCSLHGMAPAGLKRRNWSVPLPAETFRSACDAIRSWSVHRGAGLAIAVDGAVAVGTNVAFSAPLPVGYVHGTCRIVAVVDEADRFGFAYGTLPEHPERGEESFLVVRDGHGDVRFDVVGVSRPAQPIARLLPFIADRLQDTAVHRYLSAITRAVAAGSTT